MITNKIFQKDPYLRTLESSVLSSNCDEEKAEVILTDTIFFPTGGGQSCDKGFIIFDENKYPVIDVYEKDREVIHVIAREKASSRWPCQGSEVKMEIDWKHRFDNMQRHCGEHILSGVMFKLFQGINKGFHMGDDYITIDIDLSQSEKYSVLTWEMAEEAELAANSVIWKGAPVHTDYFETKEPASKLPLRKPLALERDISIVTIGDASSPDDCVACCGTHPRSASEVGLIKIYKIEPNKGMSRIYLEAGERALRGYQKQFNTLYDMSLRLSAGISDITAKCDAKISHMEDLKNQLNHFRNITINAEIEKILQNSAKLIIREYDDFSVDDLLNMSKKLEPHCTGLIALICRPHKTVLLVSCGNEGFNCGGIAKSLGSECGGKGGGKPSSARLFFREKSDMEKFKTALKSEFQTSGL